MCRRIAVWGLLILLLADAPAQADKLVLEDGRTLSGKVSKQDDGYLLVSGDGQEEFFSEDEVKRYVFESRLTPQELLANFEELEQLVLPLFDIKEPDQYQWISSWHNYISTYVDETGRIHESHRQSTGKRTSGPRDRPVDSDEFMDEWARYTAKFRSVAENLKYKQLVSRRKECGSLREYGLYTPDGQEEVARALKLALESVEECLEMADTTAKLVSSIPVQQRNHARDVRRLEDDVSRAQDKARTAKNHEKARDRISEAEDRLRQRSSRMTSQMERLAQTADARINSFAQERILAKSHLATAREVIMDFVLSEATPDSESGPGVQDDDDSVHRLSQAIQEFYRLVEKYRSEAKQVNDVRRGELRDEIHGQIKELFEKKRFTLRVSVIDVKQDGSGGYVLEAAPPATSEDDEALVTMAFRFGEKCAEALLDCGPGAKVGVDVRLYESTFTPDLAVLGTLEESDRRPRLQLGGRVLTVKSGCEPRPTR